MCSVTPYRAEKLRENELRQLRSANVMDSGDAKPGYKIYCMNCGKVPPLCLCSSSIWHEKPEVK